VASGRSPPRGKPRRQRPRITRADVALGIAAITAAAFYLNAVFAFAIIQPGRPQIRPAFTRAGSDLGVVLGSGFAVGVCLGLSAVVADRWRAFWFELSLGIVIGVMMISYVAIPSWLTGIKTTRSRRDRLTASVVGVTIGAVICAPPYILGRVTSWAASGCSCSGRRRSGRSASSSSPSG